MRPMRPITKVSRWLRCSPSADCQIDYFAATVSLWLWYAAAQIERYATDHDLVRLWNLREQGGPVTLHRIVLVFHGCDVALCEEIS